MQAILTLLSALACPLMMGGMMWLMMRTFSSNNTAQLRPQPKQSRHDNTTMQERLQDKYELQNEYEPQGAETIEAALYNTNDNNRDRGRSPSLFGSIAHCLNWRVIAVLAAIALILWFAAPHVALAALPLLVSIICPASMLLMLVGMFTSHSHHAVAEQTQHACCPPTASTEQTTQSR